MAHFRVRRERNSNKDGNNGLPAPAEEFSMNRHPALLDRLTSALVVVDMQEPFLNAIHGRDALTANVALLVRAARTLGVPVLATVQYVQRMGGVVPAIAEALPDGYFPLDKLTFSCAEDPAFVKALKDIGRKQIVVCGVETHICVSQTAHDLLEAGCQVHVAADAVSSRTLEKHKLGMERIRDAGIKPCAAEAAVYEWLRAAGTPEFKAILALVR
jgi:nicotinamidase-related amidase